MAARRKGSVAVTASPVPVVVIPVLATDGDQAATDTRQLPLPLEWSLPTGVPVLPRGDAGDQRPDPHRWAAGLVQSLLEVLAGDRPPQQVMRWLDTSIYDGLQAVLRSHPRRPGPPGVVRSVHVCRPHGDAAEVTVVVGVGTRVRAVALRLDGVGARWRCTRLAIL